MRVFDISKWFFSIHIFLASFGAFAQSTSYLDYFVLKPSKCEIGETKFFDNKELNGEPAYVLSQAGLFQGKKKVCGWPKPCVKDSALVNCPGTSPIGQPSERRLGSIEIEPKVGDVFETKAAGVSLYFKAPNADDFRLKDAPVMQLKKKAKAAEQFLTDNKSVLNWRDKFNKCLDLGDARCIKSSFVIPSKDVIVPDQKKACRDHLKKDEYLCRLDSSETLKQCLTLSPEHMMTFTDEKIEQYWGNVECRFEKENGSWKIRRLIAGDSELAFYPEENELPINQSDKPVYVESWRKDGD